MEQVIDLLATDDKANIILAIQTMHYALGFDKETITRLMLAYVDNRPTNDMEMQTPKFLYIPILNKLDLLGDRAMYYDLSAKTLFTVLNSIVRYYTSTEPYYTLPKMMCKKVYQWQALQWHLLTTYDAKDNRYGIPFRGNIIQVEFQIDNQITHTWNK